MKTLDNAITAVKKKSRKGSQVIAKSLVTLKDRAVANMAAFKKSLKK